MTAETSIRGRLWLLFLLTFSIPLRDQSLLSLPGANLRAGDVFILLGIGLVVWDILVRQKPIAVSPMDVVLLTFLTYTLTSLLWSLDPVFGAARVGKLFRNLVFYVVIVWELRRNFSTGFRALTYGAVASFSYLLCYLAYAVAFGKVSLAKIAAQRVLGSAELSEWRDQALGSASFGGGTINALGMWSAVTLLLWFGASSAVRRSKHPVLFWTVSGVLTTMTLATLSRGVWLGLALALIAWLFLMRGRLRIHRWVLITAGIGTVAFSGAIASTSVAMLIVGRVRSAEDPVKDASISERLKLWAAARELVRQNPLLGVGAGGTSVGVPAVSSYSKWFVHNLYFQLSAEFGLVGFFLWIGVIILAVCRVFIVRQTLVDSPNATLYRMSSAMIALVGLCLIIGLTGLDFAEMEWWVFLATTTALPMAVIAQDSREFTTEGPR